MAGDSLGPRGFFAVLHRLIFETSLKDILLNLIQVLGSCFLIGCAGSIAGRLVRQWIVSEKSYLFAWVFTAIGLGFFTLILGLCHLLYKPVFMVLWGVITFFGAPSLWAEIRRQRAQLISFIIDCTTIERVLLTLLMVRMAIIFLGGTLILPWGGAESDVLHYHLVLPRLYMAPAFHVALWNGASQINTLCCSICFISLVIPSWDLCSLNRLFF